MQSHGYLQRDWTDIVEGAALPEIRDTMSFTRVASALSATLDYFPVHHDPNYARDKGHPNVLLSTIQIMGLVDRAVTDWTGPESFIRRRSVRLSAPIYPDDQVRIFGHVLAKHLEWRGSSGHFVDFAVTIEKADAVRCCDAEVTIELPVEGSANGWRLL